jgi:uncharacterized protein YegL
MAPTTGDSIVLMLLRKAAAWVVLVSFFVQTVHPPMWDGALRFRFGPSVAEGAEPTAFEPVPGAEPEIVVARRVAPVPMADGTIRITYTVANRTIDDLTGVLLTTTLEPAASYAGAQPAADRSGRELAWSLGSVEPFGTTTVDLFVQSGTTAPATLDLGAEVYATRITRPISAATEPATPVRAGLDPALLQCTVDADCDDSIVVATAATLGYDAARIFSFVRDEISFEAYRGSLRGARGTLGSGAGNALDQASLLVALLRASGIPARYARGSLSVSDAQELIRAMFDEPAGVASAAFDGVALAPQLATLADTSFAQGLATAEEAARLRSLSDLADPENDPALLGEVSDHFWVQLDQGGGFQPADPAFPSSAIGQARGASPSTFAEVPEDLRHYITARLVVERNTSAAFGLFGRTTPLERRIPSAALSGRSVSLSHDVSRTDQGDLIGSQTTYTYTPALRVEGAPPVLGESYVEIFNPLLGGFVDATLSGVFVEVDVESPGARLKTYTTTLQDRVGFVTRSNPSFGLTPLAPIARDREVPAITPVDVLVLSVATGREDPRDIGRRTGIIEQSRAAVVAADQGAQALIDRGVDDPSTLPAGERAEIEALMQPLAPAVSLANAQLGALFHLHSDHATRVVSETARVRSYVAEPQVVAIGFRAEMSGAEVRGATHFDILENRSRVIAAPGVPEVMAFSFRFARGQLQNFLEGFLLELASDGAKAPTAIEVVAAAQRDALPVLLLGRENADRLASLSIDDESKLRIARALDAGLTVLMPDRSVVLDGAPAFGWLEIDADGHAVGRLPDGTGGSFVDFVVSIRRFVTSSGFRVGFWKGFTAASVAAVTGVLRVLTGDNFVGAVIAGNVAFERGSDFIATFIATAAIRAANREVARCGFFDIFPFPGPARPTPITVFDGQFVIGCTVGVATVVGFLTALFASVSADPPVGAFTLGRATLASDPLETSELELSANLAPGTFSATTTVDHFAVQRAAGEAWRGETERGLSLLELEASNASVRSLAGAPVGTGRVAVFAGAAPAGGAAAVVRAGTIDYTVLTERSVAYYAPSTSGLGASAGEIGTESALSLAGDVAVDVPSARVALGGAALPEAPYTIVTTQANVSLDGPGATATFAPSSTLVFENGSFALRPGIQPLLVAGITVAPGESLSVADFAGRATLSASGDRDQLDVDGTAGALLRVRAAPAQIATTQSTPVSFQIAADTTLADTYTLRVETPDGWNVAFPSPETVTVTPPAGVQSGAFPVRVLAVSRSRPALRAEAEVAVTIGATVPGVALALVPDALFSVPVGGAQLPSAFEARIRNVGPLPARFALAVDLVPGFDVVRSADTLLVGAGRTGSVGVYLRPNGPLPAPGTAVTVRARATSTSEPTVTASANAAFTVPEVRGVSLSVAPAVSSAAAGGVLPARVMLQSLGNVSEGVALRAEALPGLTITGLPASVLTLGAGTTVELDVDVAIGASAVLGSLVATFTADFCATLPQGACIDALSDSLPTGPGERTASLTVSVRSPALAAFESLTRSIADAPELAGAFGDVLAALILLEADPADASARAAVSLRLDRLRERIRNDPRFLGLDGLLAELAGASATGAVPEVFAALTDATEALAAQLPARVRFAFGAHLEPSGQRVRAGEPASLAVVLENLGSDALSLSLAVGSLPDGVSAQLSATTVQLAPGEATPSSGPGALRLDVAQSVAGPRGLDIPLTVTPAEAATLARTLTGFVFVQGAGIQIVSLRAEPLFVTEGGALTLSGAFLNQESSARDVRVALDVLGDDGASLRSLMVVPLTLAPGLDAQDAALGVLDTTGLPAGEYPLRARLQDGAGVPLGGADVTTTFYIGGVTSLSAAADPSVTAPGSPLVTTRLLVNDGVVGLGGGAAPTPPFDATRTCMNLVQNGDFSQFNLPVIINSGNPLPGWNTLGVSGTRIRNSDIFFQGRVALELFRAGPIRQAVPTVPGETYELAFRLWSFNLLSGVLPPRTAAVRVGSEEYSFTDGRFDRYGHFRSVTFVASDPQTVIEFERTDGGDTTQGLGLDDVMVCPQAAAGVAGPVIAKPVPWATSIATELSALSDPDLDASAALGAADGDFLELAPGDELVVDMAPGLVLSALGLANVNIAFADLAVVAADDGRPYELLVSADGTIFAPAQHLNGGTRVNAPFYGTRVFDLESAALPAARFVKIRAGAGGLALDAVDSVMQPQPFVIGGTGGQADFVFLVDISRSMLDEINAIRDGLGAFIEDLRARDVDARFAVVTFGGPPMLRTDFTVDRLRILESLNITPNGSGRESGLEAIRAALGATSGPLPLRGGGTRVLQFRPTARKNLILLTDENSDLPSLVANQLAGQAALAIADCDNTVQDPPNVIDGTPWQTEIDLTAQAVIERQAFLNILVTRPGDPASACQPARLADLQYGAPAADVSDPDTLLGYDPAATLANLEAMGLGDGLQAQVLRAGLVARSFDILRVAEPAFVQNFFEAKIEETTQNQPIVTAELRHELEPSAGVFDVSELDPAPEIDGNTLIFRTQWMLFAPPRIDLEIPAQLTSMAAGETRALSRGTTLDISFQPFEGEPVTQRVSVGPASVTAQRIIAVSPEVTDLPAGGEVGYAVTLDNPTDRPVTYALRAVGVDGLEVTLPGAVVLAAGERRVEALVLRAPQPTPAQMRDFRVFAEDAAQGIADSAGARARITAAGPFVQPEARGVHVVLTPLEPRAGQGTPATFRGTITNLGDRTDTFALASVVPPGFAVALTDPALSIAPGSVAARSVVVTVTPPPGTPVGSAPLTLEAVSTADANVRDADMASVDVLGLGVDVTFEPGAAMAGGPLALRVRNTGSTPDSYDLALAGEVAADATLSVPRVDLAPGASVLVPISIGALLRLAPGDRLLVGAATSRTIAAVRDIDQANVAVPSTLAVGAALSPAQSQVSTLDPVLLRLEIDNLGNQADTYSVSVSAQGAATAVLLDADGTPRTTVAAVPIFTLGKAVLSVRATPTGAGPATVIATVTSQTNANVSASTTAVIELAARAPVANAGPDRNPTVGALVTLDGSGSFDPDDAPEPLSYAWRFTVLPSGSGLTDADLLGADTVTASFVPDAPGAYTLELAVSDGADEDTDTVAVFANGAPIADAGPDRNVPAGAAVTLDGSGSFDIEGDLLTYQWRLVSVPPGSAITEQDIEGLDTPSPRFVPEAREAKVDFVFLLDTSQSLQEEIVAVRAGLSGFIQGLAARSLDARFAAVSITTRPSMLFDLTSNGASVIQAFQNLQITPCSADPACLARGNQDEVGLEAIRAVLGGALPGLSFRPDARINLILVTDEDSDRPTASPPLAGQTTPEPPNAIQGTAWQTEVDQTAALAISRGAFVNMIVNPGDAPTRDQYGDPASDVSNPVTLLEFDRVRTLERLEANGHGASLEAQLLRAGLIGRAFDIADVDDPAFVADFFAAKVEEVAEGYELELVVSDGRSASVADRARVVAYSGNVPPNAEAGLDVSAGVGVPLTLDGGASDDPDRGPASLGFAWRLAMRPAGSALTDASLAGRTSASVGLTPDVAGTYVLELEVDDGIASDSAQVRVDASAPPVPPNADAGADRAVRVCDIAVLDGSESFDVDTSTGALVFLWTVVSRPAASALTSADIEDATTPSARFQPDVEGAYVLRLAVADADGGDFDQVRVTAGACVDPAVDTDGDGLADAQETNTGVFVSGDGTGANPLVADTDGDGLEDGFEVFTSGTDPNVVDTDGDGVSDGDEIDAGTDPTVPDVPQGPVAVASGVFVETGGGATTPDTLSFTNEGTSSITSIVVDLGLSEAGAVFDPATSTGVPFAATTSGTGFTGTFALTSARRRLALAFTDFGPGETFGFRLDLDDQNGGFTTGADLAGATVVVTRSDGSVGTGVFAPVAGSDTMGMVEIVGTTTREVERAAFLETGISATEPDLLTFTNTGGASITRIAVDLGSSAAGVVFDPAVPFGITGADVGAGGITLSADRRVLLIRLSDFGPGETFMLEHDADDVNGNFTTGADIAGARVSVLLSDGTSASGVLAADASNPNLAIGTVLSTR